MKILTWNINSVRLRIGLVQKAVEMWQPDVVCLQETKTPDDAFPHDPFVQMGFSHRHVKGMKGYNGVAILSRRPFTHPEGADHAGRTDCRHIFVRFPDFELHNLYVPAGGDIPDPQQNDKFAHKLAFLDNLTAWFGRRYTPSTPLVALGDFNIAPLENDVWSHRQLLDVVSHTPIETEKLTGFQNTLQWIDTSRHFVPEPAKLYTWWSYRNRDWKASNRGRRLDHIWTTSPLKSRLKTHEIAAHTREWEQTSDHVPVLLTLS